MEGEKVGASPDPGGGGGEEEEEEEAPAADGVAGEAVVDPPSLADDGGEEVGMLLFVSEAAKVVTASFIPAAQWPVNPQAK